MRSLSSTGQLVINNLAQRHGFSQEAVLNMLDAVIAGRGGMAQSNHPEFGGSGQWMRGGMIMLSDMFNNALKSRVDALCSDLTSRLTSEPELLGGGSFQSQQQSGGLGQQQQSSYDNQQQHGFGPMGPASLFVPSTSGVAGDWWGADLGRPASTGSQNGVRYAYFPQIRRLAIDLGDRITIYDTLDHQIGGFSQQQSVGGSLTFTSQHGVVEVTRLPIVSGNNPSSSAQSAVSAASGQATISTPAPIQANTQAPPSNDTGVDIFRRIGRLADLHAKGILSTEEFTEKKKELLSRL